MINNRRLVIDRDLEREIGLIHFMSVSAQSQAGRQGLAVLMVSAVIVLKHKTSTLRQSQNFISIDLIFGVGDYVR